MSADTASRAALDLCQTVRHPDWDGAGMYRVESLTGVTEKDLRNEPDVAGFTYVELAREEEWFNAPRHAVARIIGGPFPGGDVGGWKISLKVGQTYGLFLKKPREDNRNYYDLSMLGTFEESEEGGFSNGVLFTKRRVGEDELAGLVKGLAGESIEADCPYNEEADFADAPPPVLDGAVQGDGVGEPGVQLDAGRQP